jgi:hypothetical protein
VRLGSRMMGHAGSDPGRRRRLADPQVIPLPRWSRTVPTGQDVIIDEPTNDFDLRRGILDRGRTVVGRRR